MAFTFHPTLVENVTPPLTLSANYISIEFDLSRLIFRNPNNRPLYLNVVFDEESVYEEPGDDNNEEPIISEHPWLQQFRQPLGVLFRQKLQAFMNTVQYVAHQDLIQRHGDDSEYPDGSAVSTSLINVVSDSGFGCKDDEFVLISPPKRHFHYACPFEALNPQQYRQCLLSHSLLTVDDVIHHIKRYHVKPLYCPMCSQVFGTLIERDRHIIERSCRMQELHAPKRVSTQQEATMAKATEMNTSDEEKWNYIFTTIHPNIKPPSSPYWDHGRQLTISVAKDCFMMDGKRYVSDFLHTQGLDKNVTGDQHVQTALYQLAWEDLLGDIMERYKDTDDQ